MRRALIPCVLCLSILVWGSLAADPAVAARLTPSTSVQPCGIPPAPTATGLISFVSKRNKIEGIYKANADGSAPYCIVSMGNDAPSAPAWSPDGKYLGFTLQSGLDPTNPKLYIVNGDGSNPYVLVDTTDHFSWSPTGEKLAYSRKGDIFITEVTGSPPATAALKLTKPNSGSQSPAWSPDGTLIAFSQRDGIHVVNIDGSAERNLSNSPGPGLDQYPVWSPDSAQIAFVSSRDGTQQIYTVALADGTIRRLTDQTSKRNLAPAWSPDSKAIAYVTYLSSDIHSTRIMLVSADASSPLHRLTHGGNTESDPAWAKDGTQIAFDVRFGSSDRGELHLISADGSKELNLTKNSAFVDGFPFWQP